MSALTVRSMIHSSKLALSVHVAAIVRPLRKRLFEEVSAFSAPTGRKIQVTINARTGVPLMRDGTARDA